MIPSRNSKLVLLVGPPGSGKTTLAKQYESERFIRINQDDQGKKEHLELFERALKNGDDIVVDRLNFNLIQRQRYLAPAKIEGYDTKIVVLHENYNICLERCLKRKDHPTIKEEKDAKSALHMFFTKYERVSDNEADEIVRIWPENEKKTAIIVDLDGTLCNINHRLVHVKKEGKKDWGSFFRELPNDLPNEWCVELINKFSNDHEIIFCSGRPDDHEKPTITWLNKHLSVLYGLFMRRRGDFRPDDQIKEIILDFELLSRYDIKFVVDDRDRVVKMWRDRGFTVLQCAKGDF